MNITDTLELYDLDGTCNDEDMGAVCEGKESSQEIEIYLVAAATFVDETLDIGKDEVLRGIKSQIPLIFPRRSEHGFWGTFPSATGEKTKICPAVDHFLLTPLAIEGFLKLLLAQERPESVLAQKVNSFLASDWRYPLYKYCSNLSLPYASIDEDAIGVLESRMSRGALPAIFTNSTPDKAQTMLEKAGIGSRNIVLNRVERGKIGVIGNGRKFEVNRNWVGSLSDNLPNQHLDLSDYFGEEGVVVDLRRQHFYETVFALMGQAGVGKVWMASDIPELDLFPLMNWRNLNPRVAMRVNSTSSAASIRALQAIHSVNIGRTLSKISSDLE